MKVVVYEIKFNHDERCYETGIHANINVDDYDEYTNIVTLSSQITNIKQARLDTVELIENNGYYVTASALCAKDCFMSILNSMTKHSSAIISAETDRLELLSQVVVDM